MNFRRSWSQDKGGWRCCMTSRGEYIKLKVTEGGEVKLFGLPDDKSELQVADVMQYATHMEIFAPYYIVPLRDWMTKFCKVLQTADDPVPSLEALTILYLDKRLLVLDAIKSKKLSSLKSLALKYASLPDVVVDTLASVIDAACLPSLKHLELECYERSDSDMGHNSLAEVIESGRMLTLETLILKGTGVEDAGCEAYANAIISGKLPSLKCLNLSDNRIGMRGIEALGRAIESGELKNLTEFDLSYSDLGSWGGHFIFAEHMGSGRLHALETLNLGTTMMYFEHCEAYARAIISGKLPSLSRIQFKANSIGNKGAEAIGRAIRSRELKNLAELDLRTNQITNEGMSSLATCIQEGDPDVLLNLRYLDLSYNRFTKAGLLALTVALKSGRLNSLEVLSLNSIASSKEGASALVSAFSNNIHLTVNVDYAWDEFPILRRHVEQLRKRNLNVKDISAGLVDSLVVPATFGKVYLCGNPNAGKTTLRRTLQRNRFESMIMWERRPHTEGRTRGIDVSQLPGQGKRQDDNTTTLLVWDMAGQEDYHVVHNAFFPDLGYADGKATSFVIVCGSKNVEKESKPQMHRSVNYMKDSKKQVEYWLQQLDYWLKFIASSCGKSTDRRHVLVVLNDFDGELKISKYSQFWKQGLQILEEDFKDYLDIQTDAFIMDVRICKFVQPFKRRLLEHSTSLLKGKMIPDICQFIQKNLSRWSEGREHFPVLHWKDFVDKVHQSSSEPWPVETLESATKYLNEAGVLIYIDREASSAWDTRYQKLVVLNPSWFCRDIVGNMFLQEDMGHPTDVLFRIKVEKSTGSIYESDFKKFLKLLLGIAKEWSDEDFGDLIAILLWLGLCYKGRGQKLFIPSLIAENTTPWDHWESGNSEQYGEDQWVVGFSVEHSKSKVTIAPIALWHRFQVELAHNPKFNGHLDNDFVTGKYFINFCVDFMSVLIEVSVDKGSPTFNNICIFVKPLWKVDNLDGNRRKQHQVDLASDLVEILLGLWIKVCPGVEYLHRVVWPWPVSQPRRQVVSERDVEVEQVTKWVREYGLGRSMQWMVGSSTIKYDQLLPTKDKKDMVKKYQETVHDTLSMLRQFEREAVDEGICPANVPPEEVPDETEIVSLPRSSSGKILRKMESMEKKILKRFDNLDGLVREGFKEVLKKERQLLDKLQDTGEFLLQDRERICPRFIYLGEKDSGAWMTLKDALSPKKAARLQFLCEARFSDYRQHAVKDQQGLDLSDLKDWAKKIGPWLKVSLAVIFISAKVAANVVLPGVGLIFPNFTQWQQASSLSDAIALATAFSTDELNKYIMDEMGLDANYAHQSLSALNGKSRKALSEFLGKLTPDNYEKKLCLRKVRLSYDDGSHGIVWICRECFEMYASIDVVRELPI